MIHEIEYFRAPYGTCWTCSNGTKCPQWVHVHLVDLTIDLRHIPTQSNMILWINRLRFSTTLQTESTAILYQTWNSWSRTLSYLHWSAQKGFRCCWHERPAVGVDESAGQYLRDRIISKKHIPFIWESKDCLSHLDGIIHWVSHSHVGNSNWKEELLLATLLAFWERFAYLHSDIAQRE